jgi:hypothetical protein
VEGQQSVIAFYRQKVSTSYGRRRGRAFATGTSIRRLAAPDLFADFNLAWAQSLQWLCGIAIAGAHAVDFETGVVCAIAASANDANTSFLTP